MVKYIYGKMFSVVAKKPIRLWGMSLLADLLTGLAMALNAFTPMIGLAIVLVLNLGIAMVYLAGIRGGEINSKDLFVGFYSFVRTRGRYGLDVPLAVHLGHGARYGYHQSIFLPLYPVHSCRL